MLYDIYTSPVGDMVLGAAGERLCLCDWLSGRHMESMKRKTERKPDCEAESGNSIVLEMAKAQLDEYFAGKRREFSVPLSLKGTDFQKEVWNALAKIPYGTTVSYGWLAAHIGRPQAVRAVANANGANRISIFLPCHRVIGKDGSLTGYSGGIDVKRQLLQLEQDERQ